MLSRRPDLEMKFYDALRDSFGANTREGIHLSGLLKPRQEFWQNAVPKVATNEELGFWTAGRGHEDALSRFLQDDFGPNPGLTIEGISLRPDFVSLTGRIVPAGEDVEMKTRRSNLPETDEEANEKLSSYREQMRGYMALRRRRRMYLIVLSLSEGKTKDTLSRSSPVWAVYVEEFVNEEDMESERAMLLARRDSYLSLMAAFEAGDKAAVAMELLLVPLCADWMCGKATPNIEVKPRCLTCNKDFETEYGGKNHIHTKAGVGHDVVPPKIRWSYVPRCKWHAECEPWRIDPTRQAR